MPLGILYTIAHCASLTDMPPEHFDLRGFRQQRAASMASTAVISPAGKAADIVLIDAPDGGTQSTALARSSTAISPPIGARGDAPACRASSAAAATRRPRRARRGSSDRTSCRTLPRPIEGSGTLSDRIEIVDFEKHAAVLRLEGAVIGPRRPRGIGIRREFRSAFTSLVVADRQIARDEIDLFPVIVDERLGRVDAGRETKQPRTRAALVVLIETAGQDFLLYARRIAGRSFPPVDMSTAWNSLCSLLTPISFWSFCHLNASIDAGWKLQKCVAKSAGFMFSGTRNLIYVTT